MLSAVAPNAIAYGAILGAAALISGVP